MSLSTVIEKIQKLRRLATSSNVNEAAAAAAAADRLIQQHGLEEAQLQADGQAPGEKPSIESDPLVTWGCATPQWQLRLCCSLAAHYDCASYTNVQRTEAGTVKSFVLIGRPSDVASVRYMFAWLSLEIDRLARFDRGGSGETYRNSFRHGAVVGVMTAMRDSKKAAQAQATSAAMVLVNSRMSEAKRELSIHGPKLCSGGRIGAPRDGNGYGRGVEAGKGLHGRHGAALTGGTRALGSGS